MAQGDGSKAGGDLGLKIAGAWLQALTDGSREVVALLEEDGQVQYVSVSGAAQSILGIDAVDLADMKPADLCHPLDLPRVVDAFRAVASHPGGRITMEYRARHRGGHFVRVESTAVNRLNNPWVKAVVVHTRLASASSLMQIESSLSLGSGGTNAGQVLDDEDALLRHLDEAIQRAATANHKFSLVVVELERGEQLADAYSEDLANGVRDEVGRRLNSLLRPGDRLARLATGQYAALLEGVGDRALAERIALRIQKTVGNRFHVKGQDVLTSTVIGVSTSERRYDRADDVLRDARLAAARARGEGGERPVIFRTQLRVERTRQASLTTELHHAISSNQFRVYYLPIVSLATRTLVGFEALVRWQHPERGLISPDLFIPVANETGLIVRLGRWVLLEACRQMVEWHRRYPTDPPLSLSVNVADRQFADFDFDEQTVGIMEDTAFSPEHLTLELAETAVHANPEPVQQAVRRLKRLGVRFSLDNFGVGISSIAALQALPYDRIKIDRTLTSKLQDSDSRARELVQAIVSLTHDLRMEVVAEGVETAGQAAQLSKLWCEYAEGYLFGKPMAADGAGGLIASYPRWWS
ncbi:MAG: EAL domain-containing protein [Myxococcota bacterium]